jgi:hypothetical protein
MAIGTSHSLKSEISNLESRLRRAALSLVSRVPPTHRLGKWQSARRILSNLKSQIWYRTSAALP